MPTRAIKKGLHRQKARWACKTVVKMEIPSDMFQKVGLCLYDDYFAFLHRAVD
jgi:hypothetical protein